MYNRAKYLRNLPLKSVLSRRNLQVEVFSNTKIQSQRFLSCGDAYRTLPYIHRYKPVHFYISHMTPVFKDAYM